MSYGCTRCLAKALKPDKVPCQKQKLLAVKVLIRLYS